MALGREDSQDISRALSRGASDCLTKPIDFQLTPDRIRNVFPSSSRFRLFADCLSQIQDGDEARRSPPHWSCLHEQGPCPWHNGLRQAASRPETVSLKRLSPGIMRKRRNHKLEFPDTRTC